MGAEDDFIATLKLLGLSSSLLRLMEDLHPHCSPLNPHSYSGCDTSSPSMTLSSPTSFHPTSVSHAIGTASLSVCCPELHCAKRSSSCSSPFLEVPQPCYIRSPFESLLVCRPVICALQFTSILSLIMRGNLCIVLASELF